MLLTMTSFSTAYRPSENSLNREDNAAVMGPASFLQGCSLRASYGQQMRIRDTSYLRASAMELLVLRMLSRDRADS